MFPAAYRCVECREAVLAKVLHTIHVMQSSRGPRPATSPPSEAESAPDGGGAPVEDSSAGAAEAVERPPATPALSVAGAARGLGIAPATLRSWERRYGLVPSLHTAGGHRRYGPEDLARLQVMHRLVRDGVPPAEAARVARTARPVPAVPHVAAPYSAVLEEVEPVPRSDEPEQPAAESADASPPGGGRILPMARRPPTARGMARAAAALDAVSCRRRLSASLTDRGTVSTWAELIRPVLRSIGERWQSSGAGVEIEHSFSQVVAGVLLAHAGRMARARNDRPVLLASVPEELHDLPLLAVHAALSDVGIRSHLLGARTPPDALAAAVTRIGPPVVLLWAQMPTTFEPDLPGLRPAPRLILAGPGWGAAGEGAEPVRDLAGAVQAVVASMGL